ncbi:MAG: hypothetical protein OEZ65_04125 [Gemmatimonadota bacterium]|nr:hypothetical protein [Gemmatimonadota bacterium]MDH5758752.1 hypothetical protein [Gemmatimonadota bacterium]
MSGRAGAPRPVEEEEAYRLAALMGVAEGPGTLLLVGAPAAAAEGVARVVPGVEVVAADGAMAVWPPAPRVTRVVSRPGLPFFDGTFRGVVVDGGMGGAWIGEAARVAARAGRVVVVDPPAGAEVVLEAARMSVLARDAGTIVAARG